MDSLSFDPIQRAGELWGERVGDDTAMRLATSIMRVQQLVLGELEHALKPFGISFARYEVLRLIDFSKAGKLPLGKIGQRLMVHPASVTNVIDRLEAQGLVAREVDASDRRRTFVSLTADGRRVLAKATEALTGIGFGLDTLTPQEQERAYTVLRKLRQRDWAD